MTIDSNTVNKIAALANIHIEPAEQQSLHQDLGKILDYVDQLAEVNTDNVMPMISPFDEPADWRADRVKSGNQSAQILQNAPQQEMGFFVVPKVVDNQ